ncbi:MAG: hypothetical protein U5K54_09255 [Cytophagales bacterium]|nr:hypothetical protein [Cytophagales bacterium]
MELTWGKNAFNTGKKQRSLAFDMKIQTVCMLARKVSLDFLRSNWRYISLLDKIPEAFSRF